VDPTARGEARDPRGGDAGRLGRGVAAHLFGGGRHGRGRRDGRRLVGRLIGGLVDRLVVGLVGRRGVPAERAGLRGGGDGGQGEAGEQGTGQHQGTTSRCGRSGEPKVLSDVPRPV